MWRRAARIICYLSLRFIPELVCGDGCRTGEVCLESANSKRNPRNKYRELPVDVTTQHCQIRARFLVKNQFSLTRAVLGECSPKGN
jgi:hypothetical protein